MPVGTHTFYFAVDTTTNGSLDMNQLYFDSVRATIPPECGDKFCYHVNDIITILITITFQNNSMNWMNSTRFFSIGLGIAIFTLLFLMGCSEKEGINIPEYPNAVEDQEVKAEMLGMEFGGVRRVFTSDSFDTVYAFYEEHLRDYSPEVMSHVLEDGRQAAFTVKETEKIVTTVAVQEFSKEGKVAISYMHVDMGF